MLSLLVGRGTLSTIKERGEERDREERGEHVYMSNTTTTIIYVHT